MAMAAQMQCAGTQFLMFPVRSSSNSRAVVAQRSEFLGESSRRSLTRIGNGVGVKGGEEAEECFGGRRRRKSGGGMVCVKAEGFRFWEALGGRGLVGGEKAVNTEQGLKQLFSEPEGNGRKKGKSSDGRVEVEVVDGFAKELSGLVGGFPGGEKGLVKFLQDYPPPVKGKDESKATKELEMLREAIAGPTTKANTIAPPLLMPGMTVLVKEPRNPYHKYIGIVQRVTDGRAGVLFEGGNWDKLVAFKVTDLERTTAGPPMNNPKSAVLLQETTNTPDP